MVVTKPTVGGQIAYNVSVQEVLVLEVNRDTGAATLKHPGSSNIQLDGYYIGSAAGSLKPGSWSSWDAGNLFGGDWLATGDRQQSRRAQACRQSHPRRRQHAQLSVRQRLRSLRRQLRHRERRPRIRYRRSSDGTQFPGKVVYTGTKFNTLMLQVDPTGTGPMPLNNTSDTTVQIDSYDVLSAAGRLSTTGWNSFDEKTLAARTPGLKSPAMPTRSAK